MSTFRPSRPGVVDWLLRIALAAPFLVAGMMKIIDPGHFAQAIGNYRILPHELVHLLAIFLPWLEVVAGVFVLAGIWLRAASWLIAAMTVVFIIALSSAVYRDLNIECGCFGTAGGRAAGLRTIAMDVAILVGALWLMRRSQRTTPEPAAPLTT